MAESLGLLERDPFLGALDEALRHAAAGNGQLVLVSGEAGIGKTSLVERFIEDSAPNARTLWGACEALFTPRPLGPLYDIAQQIPSPSALRALLDGNGNRATLFAAVLDELSSGGSPALAPTLVVVEDVHWADEATLDLIKFLARRLQRTPVLLIVTYRDEELGRDHPLRLVLGDLPPRGVTRLRLPLLSEAAVALLAQQAGCSADSLYLVTGGNPFFLHEVLATDTRGPSTVPASVSDVVLAQVARRAPEARRLLELVAVVPHRIEGWLVEAVSGSGKTGVVMEECLDAGILHQEGEAFGYRHELARQAVESALAPTRRQALHAEVLHALLAHGTEQASLARLVHHAVQAEDGALVVRFAPAAARQASAQGAHREAAAHYRRALAYADMMHAEQRAEVLDGLSKECYLISQMEEAVQAVTAALAIWRALDQREKVGSGLRALSRIVGYLGHDTDAHQYAMEAVELLESLPPSQELAMAYANLSGVYMLDSDTAQTVAWGMRAIELAERLHDVETVCYTLNVMGSTEWCGGDERGKEKLDRSLELALEHGYEDKVAHAYANLGDIATKQRAYAQAMDYLQRGLAYCAAHDLDGSSQCLRGCRARARLDQGDYAGAVEDAMSILSSPGTPSIHHIPALLVLGLVRARRGDPGVEAVLDEERELALATGEMQWIAPMAAARAEWRWLRGDREQCAAEALGGVQAASHLNRPWYLGEVAIWLWRGGGMSELSEPIAPPFALEIAGGWRGAAAEWERLGSPYEQALALLEGDEAAQRAALGIFERLGATPAAEIARRRLRAAGVRGLPRGPRSATRANPHGLTPRQLEVLLLLTEGLHNPEIAERLSTTPKTVEHHVSAVLTKLDARSRAEAVGAAYQLGLIPNTSQAATTTSTLPNSKMGVR